MLVGVLPTGCRHRLVEVRQREVGEVDDFEVGVVPLDRLVVHPLRDLIADPAGTGAADDDADADLGHAVSSLG